MRLGFIESIKIEESHDISKVMLSHCWLGQIFTLDNFQCVFGCTDGCRSLKASDAELTDLWETVSNSIDAVEPSAMRKAATT